MERITIEEAFTKEYIIPCFQREYTWNTGEIEELIYDINNSKDDYCIGIVTITKYKDKIYLIDGQQRITTLYMIAIACNYFNNENDIKLNYETNELLQKPNKLKELITYNKETNNNYLFDRYKTICNIIKQNNKDQTMKQTQEKIKEKFKKVYFYEININKNINNLNHYFEVMNSRGVQLRISDIIKSWLMDFLADERKIKLNNLWNIYETMGIESYNSFEDISKKNTYSEKTIKEIINNEETKKTTKKEEKETNEDNSILDFDYFLLYTIRLYRKIVLGIKDDNKLFELKDLVDDYKKTFPKDLEEKQIIQFLNFLMKTKKIYDKKIIRNSRRNTNDDSNWTIDIKNNREEIILIQSCLRVSFTNRKQMNWIFETLEYYHTKDNKNNKYVPHMRQFIRDNYINEFIKYAKDKKVNYQTGFDTPRIVLNYLDYLIYYNKEELSKKINIMNKINTKKFKFKFRNSLEHFMPRENDNKDKNKEWVDDFGNLALLAYGTNTKMQNATPSNKANYFNENLQEYSLKLQIMTLLTLAANDWNIDMCKKLGEELIKLLDSDRKKRE